MVATDFSPRVKSQPTCSNLEQGERLTDLILRKGRLPLLQAVRLADTVCRELVLTHELGIVHGNIEPSNLWVKLDGQARITGFDFSSLIYNHKSQTLRRDSDSANGSNLYYMAPERGPSNQVLTTAADIYALGATLYSVLTGHHYLPFRTPKNQLDYLTIAYNYHLVCDRVPQPAQRYNPAVTATLDTIILKCLEKQPENRYCSVYNLKQALSEAIDELEQRRDQTYVEATIAEAAGKWQQAIQLYDAVLALDEWHSEAALARVRIYQKLLQPNIATNPTVSLQANPAQVLMEISYPRPVVHQIETIHPASNAVRKRPKAQLWEKCLLWSLPAVVAAVVTVGLLNSDIEPQPQTQFYAAALPTSTFAANPAVNPTEIALISNPKTETAFTLETTALQTSIPTSAATIQAVPTATATTYATATLLPTNTRLPSSTPRPTASATPHTPTYQYNANLPVVRPTPITQTYGTPTITKRVLITSASATTNIAISPSSQTVAIPNATTQATLATGSLIWPIRGVITTYFSAAHPGLDIASSCGTPTQAADGGTVIEAGWSTAGYGNTVVIDHGNGMHTRYAHFAVIAVIKGDKVSKGEIIGYEGSTGNSTGCHVHFEVWVNNVAVDPLRLLPQ